MACVKRPPTILQIDFEPGAEIHWGRLGRNADIAQVTRRVAGRNIQRAAKSDGQVLKIAADSVRSVNTSRAVFEERA